MKLEGYREKTVSKNRKREREDNDECADSTYGDNKKPKVIPYTEWVRKFTLWGARRTRICYMTKREFAAYSKNESDLPNNENSNDEYFKNAWFSREPIDSNER